MGRASFSPLALADDDVSDRSVMHSLLEDGAAEITGALKVITNRRLGDERWPLACAEVLRALLRADASAVAVHTPGSAHVEGRAAHRLIGRRAAPYLSPDSTPRAGIWCRVVEERPGIEQAAKIIGITVHPAPGHALTLLLFLDRATEPDDVSRARMMLEIVQPVLASSAAFRLQLALAESTSSALAGDAALILRDRYRLTRRELEVARLLLRGESNRVVADQLGISEHTARHHTERVLNKLGVRSRAAIPRALSPRRSSGPFRAAL